FWQILSSFCKSSLTYAWPEEFGNQCSSPRLPFDRQLSCHGPASDVSPRNHWLNTLELHFSGVVVTCEFVKKSDATPRRTKSLTRQLPCNPKKIKVLCSKFDVSFEFVKVIYKKFEAYASCGARGSQVFNRFTERANVNGEVR